MKATYRIAAVTMLLLFLSKPSLSDAGGISSEPDITTMGGDRNREHGYASPRAESLCLLNSVPTGTSLSQPLVITYPDRTYVFHLGDKDLIVMDLDGQVISRPKVQEDRSWGSVTYVKGDTPENDVLYVTRGPWGNPGVAAYRVESLITAGTAPVDPLGEVFFPGHQGIVSSPLYMGKEPLGQNDVDQVVVSVTNNKLVLIKGLANWKALGWEEPDKSDVRAVAGWDSGTATRLPGSKDGKEFVVTAGSFMSIVSVDDISRDIPHPSPFGTQGEGLSHITVDPKERSYLQFVTNSGHYYLFDAYDRRWVKHLQPFPAFVNTGTTTDGTTLYYGTRWEDRPGGRTQTGRLVAIDLITRQYKWDLVLTSPRQSWVNVSPLSWNQPGRKDDAAIIVGDVGGMLAAVGQNGQYKPLFLNTSASNPEIAPCSQVESTDLNYRPGFVYAARTALTNSPLMKNNWHNTQGVSTEMSVHSGRLFAGFVHQNESNSSLRILRNATNIAITDMKVSLVNGDGSETPYAGDSTPLVVGRKVNVYVTMRLEGDPLAPGVDATLNFGWGDRKVQPQTVHLTPFQDVTQKVTLIVPPKRQQVDLMAVVNPSLYNARNAHERANGIRPATVAAGSEPPAIPAGWQFAPTTADVGEVWVLDNARSLSLAVKGNDLGVQVSCPTDAQGGLTILPISVRFSAAEDKPVTADLHIQVFSGSDLVLNEWVSEEVEGNITTTLRHEFNLDDGEYTVRVTVSGPASLDESDLENNADESCTFVVDSCPTGDCGAGGRRAGDW